jgi:predicted DCC family thiol-disulfide oxidoreductase YuxK
MPHPILLYDGVCGLCNRLTQFILRHDREAGFHFAALQSPFAAGILARHGANAADLDTVYVVVNYGEPAEYLLDRGEAALYILRQLGGIWSVCAQIFELVPRSLRDIGYRWIARSRYRIFGRYDTCPLPTPETRARFLDRQNLDQ